MEGVDSLYTLSLHDVYSNAPDIDAILYTSLACESCGVPICIPLVRGPTDFDVDSSAGAVTYFGRGRGISYQQA